ncbi:MAG: TonB family protein [Hyphomicrobiaceae bacterium]
MLTVEGIDRAAFDRRPSPTSAFAALALTLVLHGAVFGALLAGAWAPFGAGGTDLDAISVEVEIVPAKAIESRVAKTAETTSRAAAVDQTDVVARPSEVVPTQPAPPKPAPAADTVQGGSRKGAPVTAELAPHRDDPALYPLPELSLARPDLAPPDPDAVELPVRTNNVHARSGEPAESHATQDRSASIPTGPSDAPSRGKDALERPARAVAAASPGSMRAFTKGVVDALGKTRPKRLTIRARGTSKVAFAIAESGELAFVRVAQSSGHRVLDEAAVDAVRRAEFPVPPAGMTLAQRTYEVPYHFR